MTSRIWRIKMFGSLRLSQADHSDDTIPPSIGGAILAYLACHTGRVHSRQELAERFWPQSDNTVARGRLRQHLTALRRQLEPSGVTPGSVLVANREEVSLNPEFVSTDTAEFESQLVRAKGAADADQLLPIYQSAVGLYEGEFLSGYHDHWVLAERERLKQLAIGALEVLVDACVAVDDAPGAIRYLNRLVSVDPLREESHFQLIRILASNRQQGAALRQYRALESILRAELAMTPSHAIQEFIGALRNDAIHPAGRPGLSVLPPTGDGGDSTEIFAENSYDDCINGMVGASSAPAPRSSTSPAQFNRKAPSRVSFALLAPILLLTTGFMLYLRRPARDDNPAHRNFSPAAAKSGRQDEVWIRRYETKAGDLDSEPTAVAADDAGYIYVTGFINTSATDVDYLTMKYSPDGVKLWEARYNGPGNDVDRARSLAVATDGSVFVTGQSLGSSGIGSERLKEADIATIKYNLAGSQVAIDRYDGAGHGCDDVCKALLDRNGRLYVLGTECVEVRKDGSARHGMVLLQYDHNLKRNWVQMYSDANGSETAGMAISLDYPGFVYVAVLCGRDTVLLKYDSAGHKLWERRHKPHGASRSHPWRLFSDNGGLYLISQVQTDLDGFSIEAIKLDYDGNEIWDNDYAPYTSGFRIGDACFGAGGIQVTGGIVSSFHAIFLMQLNTDGHIIALKQYPGNATAKPQEGRAVSADSRGMVHVTGRSHWQPLVSPNATDNFDNTEVVTLTYYYGNLIRERRYAGSDLVQSLGGTSITSDPKDNIIVAGQTFTGKTNDLVLLKYAP